MGCATIKKLAQVDAPGTPRRQGMQNMGKKLRRAGVILAGAAVVLVCVAGAKLRAESASRKVHALRVATEPVDRNAAAKHNSVGVAYMGQQRFVDAEK